MRIFNEPIILGKINKDASNRYIFKYFNTWVENKNLYIKTEYLPLGLESLIKNKFFMEEDLIQLINELSFNLEYIHNLGIVHLDIKPDNIMLRLCETKWTYILIDYSIGIDIYNSELEVKEGDAKYMAPEFSKDLEDREINEDLKAADIFSFGMTLLHVLSSMIES